MARTEKRSAGDAAEKLALRYLEQQGLVVVRRNFSCRFGELDLVMQDQRCLVIIEVRFRGSRSLVPANLTVDRRKQQKILRTAAMFLAWNERYSGSTLRFDIVGIDTDAHGKTGIHWIRDAFRPADSRL